MRDYNRQGRSVNLLNLNHVSREISSDISKINMYPQIASVPIKSIAVLTIRLCSQSYGISLVKKIKTRASILGNFEVDTRFFHLSYALFLRDDIQISKPVSLLLIYCFLTWILLFFSYTQHIRIFMFFKDFIRFLAWYCCWKRKIYQLLHVGCWCWLWGESFIPCWDFER